MADVIVTAVGSLRLSGKIPDWVVSGIIPSDGSVTIGSSAPTLGYTLTGPQLVAPPVGRLRTGKSQLSSLLAESELTNALEVSNKETVSLDTQAILSCYGKSSKVGVGVYLYTGAQPGTIPSGYVGP